MARTPALPLQYVLEDDLALELAQAGDIENTGNLKLQTVHIADEVLRYLKANQEDYVLRCIQVAP